MIVDYDTKLKINVTLSEIYSCDGHPKYDHAVRVTYHIKNIDIEDSIIKFDTERIFEDVTPLDYEHENGSISKISQRYIANLMLTIDKCYLDESIKLADNVEAKIKNCQLYSYEVIKTDVISGPSLTDKEINSMFDYIEDSMIGDTIFINANVQ